MFTTHKELDLESYLVPEKPSENSWLSGGKLGSRDAVLTFRSSILNQIPKNEECEDCDDGESIFELSAENKIGKVRSNSSLENNNLTSEESTQYSLSQSFDDYKYFQLFKSKLLNSDENRQRKNKEDESNSNYVSKMPGAFLNLKYKFIQSETKLLRAIFESHGLTEAEENEPFSILWTGVHLKPDILRNLAPYQRVNHFPRSFELTRKDRLYKNIERMQYIRGVKHYSFVPQSFLLPLEYKDLMSAHNKHRGPWIVKPAASSRGRGIYIVSAPDQISQDEHVLVSKYILNPLCIDGHKCDLRVYVLVTSFDPLIIYLYEEGLVRLATVKYDKTIDSLWNPCMHLCNYSINKYHSDYIRSSDAEDEDVGHKWTLSALLRHLKSQECNTQQLMENIEDIVIKSILASGKSIVSACRMFVPNGSNCFELYGFDILIDDTLHPWLLEINLSPSMGLDSPLDAKVKTSLITDLLTCVGIPAYNASMRSHYDNKWSRFRNVQLSRKSQPVDLTDSYANKNLEKTGFLSLTLEEQRIIKNACLQHARRGGFVRIFPREDTMHRYGVYLDPSTGIPLSIPNVQGQSYSMILYHNYNQMLFSNLFPKKLYKNLNSDMCSNDRMKQYERALELSANPSLFLSKPQEEKCVEEGKRLRTQIIKLIEGGGELTSLQARQAFAIYLECVLRRLVDEPKECHEKLILRFLNRTGGAFKTPIILHNIENIRIASKARSAMIAKLLGDYLDHYTRETESYTDAIDYYGMIPAALFNSFLRNAQESDIEAVLTLYTNHTGAIPYLYNRYGVSVPSMPPIPSGNHGLLRVLPLMVGFCSGSREINF